MKQIIPLEHVVVALREPVIVLDGERYFVVASAWTPKELEVIDFDDDAFGHRLIRIGAAANNSYPRKPAMQISVVTTDNMRREELDAAKILKIEFRIGDSVFAVRERDGELCISIDGQLAIKPIGANLVSLSAGQIGK